MSANIESFCGTCKQKWEDCMCPVSLSPATLNAWEQEAKKAIENTFLANRCPNHWDTILTLITALRKSEDENLKLKNKSTDDFFECEDILRQKDENISELKSGYLRLQASLDTVTKEKERLEKENQHLIANQGSHLGAQARRIEMQQAEIERLTAQLQEVREEAERVLKSAKFNCEAQCAESYTPRGRHAPDCWLIEVEDLCQHIITRRVSP